MFIFRKSPYNGTVPSREYVANGAIANGDVVMRVSAVANQVAAVPGGDNAAGYTCGVALHGAASGAKVLVAEALPGTVWEADCNVVANANQIGLTKTMVNAGFIATAANASNLANQGARVVVDDVVYLANGSLANKYMVRFVQSAARV